ncbi:MAG TPA: SCP2 sterol-binding domain-containing protein [Burkholderiales bacterium]
MIEVPVLAASGALLRALPDSLLSTAFAALANHALRGQRVAARLAEIEGRTLCLDLPEVGAQLYFQVRAGRLGAIAACTPAVRIRGGLRDFLALVRRREDPDTLFFQRRLCIEGDVEAGLHVKNLIDSLDYDWDAHVQDVLPAPLAHCAIEISRRLLAARA